MKFFELHFNPKIKEDLIFESFCFEPENIYEKRLGYLFVVGELKNALPQNFKFLDNLANFLKKQFYSTSIKNSAEIALKESLIKLNEYLAEIVRKDNVSWLGNINLAILNLIPDPKSNERWAINFTKTGEIEVLLLRNGQIIDIGKNLEFSEIEPYPLKIFNNIVSGKLIEEDVILILTQEVFLANFVEKISTCYPFNEKKFREILKEKEKDFLKISGVCLVCHLKKLPFKNQKIAQPIVFKEKLKKFSLLKILSPIKLKNTIKFLKLPKISKFPKIKIKNLKIPKPSLFFKFAFSKKLIFVLFFIFFLIFGFLIFRQEKKEEIKISQKILEEVKVKKIKAEVFLISRKINEANSLLQEAWQEILPQTKEKMPFQKEAIVLKEEIEKELFSLNKLEKINEPELFYEFKEKEKLIPQYILASKENLYLFNPFSSKIFVLNLSDKSEKFLDAGKNLKSGYIFNNLVLFYSQPKTLIFLKNEQFQEKSLRLPLEETDFDQIIAFDSNVYFLENKSGDILKYRFSSPQENLDFKSWLNPKFKKPFSIKSMSIDGSFWILTKENKIEKYYGGDYKETLNLKIFPFLENALKIWTKENLPYLYLLEPQKSRIIILTKKGDIVKQYQSEKFDNLFDFAVSENGKTIWLLNKTKIFKLNFNP